MLSLSKWHESNRLTSIIHVVTNQSCSNKNAVAKLNKEKLMPRSFFQAARSLAMVFNFPKHIAIRETDVYISLFILLKIIWRRKRENYQWSVQVLSNYGVLYSTECSKLCSIVQSYATL